MNDTPTQPGCPFCGKPEGVVDEIYPGTFAVICQDPDCAAIGPGASWPDAAVILWNSRVNRMDWPAGASATALIGALGICRGRGNEHRRHKAQLVRRRYRLAVFDRTGAEFYHLMCGVSSRGFNHMTVGKNGRVIHDPHPEGGELLPYNGTYSIGFLTPVSDHKPPIKE